MENIVKDLKEKLDEKKTQLTTLEKNYNEVSLLKDKLKQELESTEFALQDSQDLVNLI